LLIDIDNLSEPESLSSLYVGASRARDYLALFIDERNQGEYVQRAREYGAAVAGADTCVGD
jgi:hypothetical protein